MQSMYFILYTPLHGFNGTPLVIKYHMSKTWYYCKHCKRCFYSNGRCHMCIKISDQKEKSINIKTILKHGYKIYTKTNQDIFGDCSTHSYQSIPYCIVRVSDYQDALQAEITKYNIKINKKRKQLSQPMQVDKHTNKLCKHVT